MRTQVHGAALSSRSRLSTRTLADTYSLEIHGQGYGRAYSLMAEVMNRTSGYVWLFPHPSMYLEGYKMLSEPISITFNNQLIIVPESLN